MPYENNMGHFPSYQSFADAIAVLALPISCSELHGVMCGYLCAGAFLEGEMYLRALTVKEKNKATRAAALAMFEIYGISKQQISQLDFEFKLLLPPDHLPLIERAEAFCEWCEGFTQGLTLSAISFDNLIDEETQEVLLHFFEFAALDYQSLDIDEENDEKALMEVSEYARMAVLRLSGDLQANKSGDTSFDTTH